MVHDLGHLDRRHDLGNVTNFDPNFLSGKCTKSIKSKFKSILRIWGFHLHPTSSKSVKCSRSYSTLKIAKNHENHNFRLFGRYDTKIEFLKFLCTRSGKSRKISRKSKIRAKPVIGMTLNSRSRTLKSKKKI